MDDIRAVLDAQAAGARRILGISEGGPMSALFAATYPERTEAFDPLRHLSLRTAWAPDYPGDSDSTARMPRDEEMRRTWGSPEAIRKMLAGWLAPSMAQRSSAFARGRASSCAWERAREPRSPSSE